MLTRAFNCSNCKRPFGCTYGEPALPSLHASTCYECTPSPIFAVPLSQRGLIDFLNQPAFKRTDEGYDYTLPINEPVCLGCNHAISIFDGELAFVANCGHYLCQDCDRWRAVRSLGGFSNLPHGRSLICTICRTAPNGPKPFPADTLLAAFSSEIKNRGIQELNERFNEKEKQNKALVAEKTRLEAMIAKNAKERGNGAVKHCGDCGIELPVERLYKCKDCDTINCGNCCFDSHREHSVEKLLGIELDQLQKQNDKRYTEILGGLHGNLRHIQTTIDDAVLNVVAVGKECLVKISTSAQYEDAQNIATTIDKAANRFEQHYEKYIPAARRFATKLTELGEELTEYQK